MNTINKERFTYTKIPSGALDNLQFDLLQVPESSRIYDSRKSDDFKFNVFSGPLKSQVVSALDKSISEEKIETANYWGFQLLFSGYSELLLQKLINSAGKQVNISNPRLPTFILKKLNDWYKITTNKIYDKKQCIHLRNNQEIRHLIVELISILTLSRKRKMETLPKLNQKDFNVIYFKSKLEGKDTELIENILCENDPSEIRIVANEFLFQLMNKNINKALYWLSWMLEWEKINIKKYKIFDVHARYNENIDKKYVKNIIWLIWEIINYVKKSNFDIELECHQELNSLWTLYKMDFTSGNRSRKLIFVIWSIKFLCTPKCDWTIKLIERPSIYFNSLANVNIMARKIKPHEINKDIFQNEKYKILITDNYIISGNKDKLAHNSKLKEEQKRLNDIKKMDMIRLKQAKKKKISIHSMNKIDTLMKIDKYINL
jgi:hypothetical protein